MAYYIISLGSDVAHKFQERIPFLKQAIWIKDAKNLANAVSSPSDDATFFVHFEGSRELIDSFVLTIREKLPTAKIIYLIDENKTFDLKTHQMTPVGGDAYVPLQVEMPKLAGILESLSPINQRGNRLDKSTEGSVRIKSEKDIEGFKNHPKSLKLDQVFAEVLGSTPKKPAWQSVSNLIEQPGLTEEEKKPSFSPPNKKALSAGAAMSDKEISLDDMGELKLVDDEIETNPDVDDGSLDLSFEDSVDLDLAADATTTNVSGPATDKDSGFDLNFDEGFTLETHAPVVEEKEEATRAVSIHEMNEDLSFSMDDDHSSNDLTFDEDGEEPPSLDFATEVEEDEEIEVSDSEASESMGLDFSDDLDVGGIDLSDDAMEKLKEIDAIMDLDASQVGIKLDLGQKHPSQEDDSDIDTSLVADDLDLGSLNFSSEEESEPVKEEKTKKKAPKEIRESYEGNIGRDLKEISGAYSGDLERMQATISNLRSDREELMAKIQRFEDDKTMQNRHTLTIRAELDEKKIELSIIRKKLNDENTDLKDRLKLFEEKKLILEEKNRILTVELDKAGQKNKIDVKKVQMRERELEQKLELLKADSETQIRHRDLKILELKRKLDAMEFDIESISVQEKRSVESRFELEDKLDKAIKTLRNAITVLEDESEKSGVLEALKKNIDM